MARPGSQRWRKEIVAGRSRCGGRRLCDLNVPMVAGDGGIALVSVSAECSAARNSSLAVSAFKQYTRVASSRITDAEPERARQQRVKRTPLTLDPLWEPSTRPWRVPTHRK